MNALRGLLLAAVDVPAEQKKRVDVLVCISLLLTVFLCTPDVFKAFNLIYTFC